MADFSEELDFRMRALETRIANIGGFGGVDPRIAAATQCGTGICTACIVEDAINIILPGVDRPMSGKEIATALSRLKELEG